MNARPRRQRGPVSFAEDLFALADLPQPRLALGHLRWPEQARFPVNHAEARVQDPVMGDLAHASDPLIVTGFASIAKIIEFIAVRPPEAAARVLLGWEPFGSQRLSFGSSTAEFDQDVRRYWVEQHGVSLLLSAKIVQAIQAAEGGWLQVRFMPGHDHLHAKIYVGDQAATVGSSNFTQAGLHSQLEANARFDATGDGDRFGQLRSIAENFWGTGTDWSQQFVALLRDMLRLVPWREALARACADLLEGQWAGDDLLAGDATPLWPSQIAGIAEALWVVENVGSVLVADATGSGKTRMGAHLTRAVRDRMRDTGRTRSDLTVLVCPPAVETAWMREAVGCGLTIRTVSHGLLSRPSVAGERVQEDEVAKAQILAVDEAHNFLTTTSNRTRQVRESSADHVLMFTATPINRGAADLLSLVDLLGPDNFEDATLDVLNSLMRRGREPLLVEEEKLILRQEIQRFTVRRTKSMLNQLVDADPDAYRDAESGRVCRYPEHRTFTYGTGESRHDQELAEQIREHAQALMGVRLLGDDLAVPLALRREYDDARWLALRLASASGLAAHHVLAALRSSKAALLEHLRGTEAAVATLRIEHLTKPQPSGDQIGGVAGVRLRGRPVANLDCEVPDWLREDSAWERACDNDLEHYQAIERCVLALDESREHAKAQQIAQLARTHDRVLAFDRHPITLAVLRPMIDAGPTPILVASGAEKRNRARVTQLFAPDSSDCAVALCSDVMNEGINLQGASCIVHLDMPTTLRAAEQRVGRVDRMNSRHDHIEVWWPADGPSFATRANELLAAREAESSALLGSNLAIPWARLSPDSVIDHTTFAAIDTERAVEWDGIRDALDPVRGLVTGPEALISAAVYASQRTAEHRVMSSISPIRTSTPWAFFAVAGTRHGAPRWILIDGGDQMRPTYGLHEVTARLRDLLGEDPPQRELDQDCEHWLTRFIGAAARAETKLLPRRDQRALTQMSASIRAWATAARQIGDFTLGDRWQAIYEAINAQPLDGDAGIPDRHELAAAWLLLTRDRRAAYRAHHRRRRFVTLSDLDDDLHQHPLGVADVEHALTGVRFVPSFEHRVAACILGVPEVA